MKCIRCKYFKILYPPVKQYDCGKVTCTKYDLFMDYTHKRTLDHLECPKKGDDKNDDL